MNVDICYAVKDRETGVYYCGVNSWSQQLRDAKLYHSRLYAQQAVDKHPTRDLGMIRVQIAEIGEGMESENEDRTVRR